MNHLQYRKTTDAPLPGPTIYRLASERRYGEIPIHVKAAPQDIYWADRYGSTALHVLCCSRQVGEHLSRAIDAIIDLDADLIAMPNEASWTPLHLACEKRLLWRSNHATSEMVLKLVEACPRAVSVQLQTGYKAKTPFHIACETNAGVDVLRAMLAADPSLASQSYISKEKKSENPLEVLWNAQIRDPQTNFWDSLLKMEALLRAACCTTVTTPSEGSNANNDSFSIVCAMCTIRCPRDYMSRVLSMHKDQISIPDARTGRLPLHCAILAAEERDQLSTSTAFLIDNLIEEYAEAANVPFRPNGKILPLHVAITDRGLTWNKGGVRSLALASPDVVKTPDPRSRLVPALESAVDAYQSRLHLSTTYELLRLAPEILQEGYFSTKTGKH